jgi:hypothetical protein
MTRLMIFPQFVKPGSEKGSMAGLMVSVAHHMGPVLRMRPVFFARHEEGKRQRYRGN